jgi:hypothetical protein
VSLEATKTIATITLGAGLRIVANDSITIDKAKVIDMAGNISSVNVVFTAPNFIPIINNIEISDDTGNADDFITKNASQTLTNISNTNSGTYLIGNLCPACIACFFETINTVI